MDMTVFPCQNLVKVWSVIYPPSQRASMIWLVPMDSFGLTVLLHSIFKTEPLQPKNRKASNQFVALKQISFNVLLWR